MVIEDDDIGIKKNKAAKKDCEQYGDTWISCIMGVFKDEMKDKAKSLLSKVADMSLKGIAKLVKTNIGTIIVEKVIKDKISKVLDGKTLKQLINELKETSTEKQQTHLREENEKDHKQKGKGSKGYEIDEMD